MIISKLYHLFISRTLVVPPLQHGLLDTYIHFTSHPPLSIIFIPRLLAFVEYRTLIHPDSFISPVHIDRIPGSSHLCIALFEPKAGIAVATASATVPRRTHVTRPGIFHPRRRGISVPPTVSRQILVGPSSDRVSYRVKNALAAAG